MKFKVCNILDPSTLVGVVDSTSKTDSHRQTIAGSHFLRERQVVFFPDDDSSLLYDFLSPHDLQIVSGYVLICPLLL